jgi:diacylglycerol kinase
MFNTALESLAAAVTSDRDRRIANALDMARAAVLLTAVGAAVVGIIVLGLRLGLLLGW